MKSIIAVSFVTLVVWTNLQGALPGTQPGVSAEITFTSGLDEQNNPIDDLAEISLEKDGIDIYIYSRWEGIPDGQHQYAYKLFGNTGQLVLTHPFDFTSTTGSYRIWSERKFRRTAVDKTGDWRVEVLLDGQKVAERTLRVLDRWGRRYSPTRPMLEDAQVEQLLVEAHDLMKRGLYEDTVKVFKQANRQSGGDCEDCLLGLAQAFNKMGAFKNAAKEARRAVEASTYLANRIRAYSELGFALLSAEDNKESLGEAEQAFTKILELSEGDSNMARFNLAHVLLRLKRETEARALLREFIDYDPESATADRARAILKNPRRASEPAAPDFSMVTLDGEYLTSEDLQGKVALLDFWATWCGPCKAALPALRRLSKKMEKDPFVLISLSSEDESVIRAFVEANRMNWLQYRDERGHFSQNLFPSRTLPTYVLIDHEGIIVFRSTGWSSSKERALTSRVSKAIKTARKAQPPRREQEQHNQPVEASSKDSLPDLDEQSGRTDQGKKTQTLPGRVNVSELALDSTNPSTLYAGTDDIGVSKSTDRGAHWTPINNGLTNARKEIRRSGSDDRETPKRSPRSRKRRVVPPLKTLHVFDIKLERPPYTSEQAHSPRIAFVSMRNGKADLYSINPDGTGLTNLTRHPSSDAYPSWSPDGVRIAFRRGFDFYVMKGVLPRFHGRFRKECFLLN